MGLIGRDVTQLFVAMTGWMGRRFRQPQEGRRCLPAVRLLAPALLAGMIFSPFALNAQQVVQQPGQAQNGAPSDTTIAADGEVSLDMDDSLDVGLDWPDMDAEVPVDAPALAGEDQAQEQEQSSPEVANSEETIDFEDVGEPGEQQSLADDGTDRRYKVVLRGLDGLLDSESKDRFNSLSLLKEGDGKATNLAQINRRLKEDADLLDRILRAKGYYSASIRTAVRPPSAGEEKLRAVLNVRPGERYTLSSILLPGLSIAARRVPALETVFPLHVGDPVDADQILAGQTKLAVELGENGFPFAEVRDPVVTIDHEKDQGALEMPVRAGGYRRFGNIELSEGTAELFSAKHLYRIARFDRDDVYKASDIEDLRRAIVATGLVSSVTVKPIDQGDGEHAAVEVAATAGPMRTVAGEVGYGTGEGYRVEASWQHRNFFPPEGAITARGLLGTREQAVGVSYRRNNFKRRDNILSAGLSVRHQNLDAFEAKTISLTGSLERQTNIIYQKKWAWSIGAELIASRERDIFASTQTETERDYLIFALPGSVTYDASDDLLDPSKGFRLGARISPEVAEQSGTFTYVRAQADGSLYVPVGEKVVMASRVRLGTILGGVSSDRIAPSRRFYAGGGASVRGYGYQAIGPQDANNDPLGGKSLAEFSLEARIRLGTFGVVPFVDAGNISSSFLPRLSDVRVGAGVGLRYYSNFGPIRIDVGTPINPQPGDSRIAVYVSLGQAF